MHRRCSSRAELVHIACHGSFRRDNPMFSSLHVADGPLNVYDLERLARLPVVVVLSSCSVANAKVVQGGSLLGLANAFTTLGAASVIAPLTPISDAAVGDGDGPAAPRARRRRRPGGGAGGGDDDPRRRRSHGRRVHRPRRLTADPDTTLCAANTDRERRTA